MNRMLKFQITRRSPLEGAADLLAVPVTGRPSPNDPLLGPLGKALRVDLADLARRELFEGKADQQLWVSGGGGAPARRVLLVGVNPSAAAYLRLRTFATLAVRGAVAHNLRKVAMRLPDVGSLDAPGWAEAVFVGAETGAYRFSAYLTGERKPRAAVESVRICVPSTVKAPPRRALEEAVRRARAAADAVRTVRDWVNEPANVMTPTSLARRAVDLARGAGLEVAVWGPAEIRRRGMRLLAAVGAGSREPVRFIRLRYRPRKPSGRRIVVVGKGLTFDAGGLCLKQPKGMQDMKCDMAGGATMIALMGAVAARRPPHEVIALVPATENMTGAGAMRPGDVVRSLGGKTVEIVNTDAEGRLILADAFGYALTLKPSAIVDFATLTGACMVALGPYCAGVFSSSDDEAGRFLRAAAATGEQFWRLPLADDIKDHLKSDVADVKNVGEQHGGAIVAGLFLQHFVGSVPWIHVDVAGPAFLDRAAPYAPKGGTGFGIPTLLRYIEEA